MLRNDASSEWDLDIKTTLLLCQRGRKLEELSVSFGVRTMHVLHQNMPLLTSLRALHIISFRADDTCAYVIREFRHFFVDNISHNPEMKLEYLAMDGNVERLVRRKPLPPPRKIDIKGKGKELLKKSKEKGYNMGIAMNEQLADLILSGGGWASSSSNPSSAINVGEWDSSEEEDVEMEGDDENGAETLSKKVGLRVETVEGVRFWEVNGIKIFEKEVVYGRL